jgi:ABC-type phosphate transport system substrate-binding protein
MTLPPGVQEVCALKKLLVVSIVTLSLVAPSAQSAPAPFQLIAHPAVSGTTVSKDVVAGIFLKKVQRWGDGQLIEPVDLTAASPVREAFSEEMLGMPVAGVRTYWMDRMGKGLWPPRIKEADEDVIGFVAGHPCGIGYVAAGTPLPASVKVLKVL